MPGSSSSPNGNNVNAVSSLMERRSGKCHGTFTLLRFSDFSADALTCTPADSKVRNALIMAFNLPVCLSPDTPMRIQASKQCCEFFSLIEFLVSSGASSTPCRIVCSHDSCGFGRFLGVVLGLNEPPRTIWTTDSSSPLTAASAASPARMVADVTSVLRDNPGWETVS